MSISVDMELVTARNVADSAKIEPEDSEKTEKVVMKEATEEPKTPWYRATSLKICILSAILIAGFSLYMSMNATERTVSNLVITNNKQHAKVADAIESKQVDAVEDEILASGNGDPIQMGDVRIAHEAPSSSSSSVPITSDHYDMKHYFDSSAPSSFDQFDSAGDSGRTGVTSASSGDEGQLNLPATSSSGNNDTTSSNLNISMIAESSSPTSVDLKMPSFATTETDAYLCTSFDLSSMSEQSLKLTGIEPNADMKSVHHMLVFGCVAPASNKPVWHCKMEPACNDGESVLYGWGLNAPKIRLPEGAAFSVGPGSPIQHIVLQVHYLQLRGADDASGVKLQFSRKPTQFSAGVLAFSNNGFKIPAGKASHLVSSECCYRGWQPISGFAFRVHTHALGRSVFLSRNSPANAQMTTVAEQNPQLPQGFYPIGKPVRIAPGDRLRATCEYNSTSVKQSSGAGFTAADEMCNLYLMLTSEVPYSGWCNDNKLDVARIGGTGALPSLGQATEEKQLWRPPREVGTTRIADMSSVAADVSSESLFVLHRGARVWDDKTFDSKTKLLVDQKPIDVAPIMLVDRDTGKVKSSFGEGELFLPHMLSIAESSISSDGKTIESHLWVVDSGSHQVHKYHAATGKRVMSIGKAHQPGKGDGKQVQFCQPTHAIESRAGKLYVADGYCNQRIVVLSPKDGTMLHEWSLESIGASILAFVDGKTEPGNSTTPDVDFKLPLPHSLAIDECADRLYVADREAGYVYALRLKDGSLDSFWDLGSKGNAGLPYAIHVGPYGIPLALVWDRAKTGLSALVALNPGLEGAAGALVPDGGDTGGRFVQAGSYELFELAGVSAPHDFALMPAPLASNGAGERLLSIVVAESALASPSTSPSPSTSAPEPRNLLKKFVLASSSVPMSSVNNVFDAPQTAPADAGGPAVDEFGADSAKPDSSSEVSGELSSEQSSSELPPVDPVFDSTSSSANQPEGDSFDLPASAGLGLETDSSIAEPAVSEDDAFAMFPSDTSSSSSPADRLTDPATSSSSSPTDLTTDDHQLNQQLTQDEARLNELMTGGGDKTKPIDPSPSVSSDAGLTSPTPSSADAAFDGSLDGLGLSLVNADATTAPAATPTTASDAAVSSPSSPLKQVVSSSASSSPAEPTQSIVKP